MGEGEKKEKKRKTLESELEKGALDVKSKKFSYQQGGGK